MVLPSVTGTDTKPEAGVDSKSLAVMESEYNLLDSQSFALTATLGFLLYSLGPSYFIIKKIDIYLVLQLRNA